MSDTLLDDDGVPEEVNDEFLAKLDAVADAEARVADLTAELDRIDIGLDEEDIRRLLWAHLTGWSLSDITEAFEAVENLQRRDSRELTVRLLAQLSNLQPHNASTESLSGRAWPVLGVPPTPQRFY